MERLKSAVFVLSLLICLPIKCSYQECENYSYFIPFAQSVVVGLTMYLLTRCCSARHQGNYEQRLAGLEEKSDVELRVMGGLLLSAQGQDSVKRYFKTIIPKEEDKDILIGGAFEANRALLTKILKE